MPTELGVMMLLINLTCIIWLICLTIDKSDKTQEISKLTVSNQMLEDRYYYYLKKYLELYNLHYGKIDDGTE